MYLNFSTAEIDLSSKRIEIHQTPEQLVRKFLGGRGLNMYYLYKLLTKEMDPLSPDNPLIVGAGLLTGTPAPAASRTNFSAKSPESLIFADANVGGFFGAEMRHSGFDRLIITGKADSPVYLYLENGRIEIRDAEGLWGLNVNETQIKLREKLGSDIEVACIGRSGEHLVRFAAVLTGVKNTAGRGGLGAVMGSKNLKAIVAHGTRDIQLANAKQFLETLVELKDLLLTSKMVQTLGRVGTTILYDVSNVLGTVRTENSLKNAFDDSLLSSEFEKQADKMLSCFVCPVHCRHRNKHGGEGPDYSTFGTLGAGCGVSGADVAADINNVCNDLGLDSSSAGTIISWAIELYQRGLITREQTGREYRFGDAELVKSLLHDITERRGFGNALAESTRAVSVLGEETKDYVIAIKGLPQSDSHDVRYLVSFALGIAVAGRGADHLRNRPTLEILGLPPEALNRIYGTTIHPDPTAYETKEHLVYYHENIYAAVDTLGLCKFVCHGFNSPHMLDYDAFARLIEYGTGLELSKDDLMEIGKRIVDLERLINARLGVDGKYDTLPRRFFDDPAPLRVAKGHKIDREKFSQLLQRYYALRGWTTDGVPTEERRLELE